MIPLPAPQNKGKENRNDEHDESNGERELRGKVIKELKNKM